MTSVLDTELVLDEHAQNVLFREARTAKNFSPEPVTDEQLRAVYDMVKYAPTAMNLQPLRMVLVRSDEAKQRLLRHVAEGNRRKVDSAPVVAILAADIDFHDELPRVYPHVPNLRDAFADEAKRESSARFNATLQVAYFILGVRAAGLAAGPMTGFDPAGVDAEFFPDGRHRSLVLVNIGRPGENAWYDRDPRLDYDEVVTTV
jgi:nitroreductase